MDGCSYMGSSFEAKVGNQTMAPDTIDCKDSQDFEAKMCTDSPLIDSWSTDPRGSRYPQWHLGPGYSNIGYLDPLGTILQCPMNAESGPRPSHQPLIRQRVLRRLVLTPTSCTTMHRCQASGSPFALSSMLAQGFYF